MMVLFISVESLEFRRVNRLYHRQTSPLDCLLSISCVETVEGRLSLMQLGPFISIPYLIACFRYLVAPKVGCLEILRRPRLFTLLDEFSDVWGDLAFRYRRATALLEKPLGFDEIEAEDPVEIEHSRFF